MRIILANELLSKERQTEILSSKTAGVSVTKDAVLFTRMYSADTTVREVAENANEVWELYSTKSDFLLWDCTVHPPKNITDWPSKQFSQVMGPKSKTLQDAGWFPSGTWMVLPPNVKPSQFSSTNYEDFQYNQPQGLPTLTGKVKFNDSSLMDGTSRLLPSKVMASVTTRFEEDAKFEGIEAHEARALRLVHREKERKRRRDRAAKLDQRIQILETQSSEKTRKVSDQVRRMLVKSRAVGDERLEQQDRVYFECLVDGGAENEALDREFRFFSPQDTFAKIGSSFMRPPSERKLIHVEILIKKMTESGGEYRRIPVTMRVYEAIAGTFLTGELDQIIVRWFPEDSYATPSVLDTDCDDNCIREGKSSDADAASADFSRTKEGQDVAPAVGEDYMIEEHTFEDANLTAAILRMDDDKGKTTKKSSGATAKVRNMLIKSKASGDSKRIPKMEDRYFLEVVLFDKTAQVASSKFYYLAIRDPLERILQTMGTASNRDAWEFLVPLPQGQNKWYSRINEPSIQLTEATAKGILNSFDRLILRPR
jgi:hypothetical protein